MNWFNSHSEIEKLINMKIEHDGAILVIIANEINS